MYSIITAVKMTIDELLSNCQNYSTGSCSCVHLNINIKLLDLNCLKEDLYVPEMWMFSSMGLNFFIMAAIPGSLAVVVTLPIHQTSDSLKKIIFIKKKKNYYRHIGAALVIRN